MELQTAEREIEDHLVAMEMLGDTMVGLESIAASLEAMAAPLDAQAARFMSLAFEACVEPVGLVTTLPSLESYTSPKRAHLATQLSMETVGETLNRAWEALVALVKRVWEAIYNFFHSTREQAEKASKKADALRAKLGATKEWPTSATFKLAPHLAAEIQHGSQFPFTSVEIKAFCDHFMQTSHALYRYWSSCEDVVTDVVGKKYSSIFKGGNNDWSNYTAKLKVVYDALNGKELSLVGVRFGPQALGGDMLPGNRVLTVKTESLGQESESGDSIDQFIHCAKAVAGLTFQIGRAEKAPVAPTSDVEIHRPSKNEAEQIAQSVGQFADRVASHFLSYSDSATKRMIGQLDKNKRLTEKEREAIRLAIRSMAVFGQINAAWAKEALRAVHVYLQVLPHTAKEDGSSSTAAPVAAAA